MDEIEDEYKISIEKIEEEFFSQFKKGMPLSEIEKIYLLKLKKARGQYDKSFERYLQSQKRSISNKKKYMPPQETSPFQVNPLSISPTRYDRFKFQLKMFFFHLSRTLKNFNSYITPKKLIYLKFLIKINVRRIMQIIEDRFLETVSSLQNNCISFFTGIGKFFVSISQKIKFLLSNLKKIFKKEKKVPENKVAPPEISPDKKNSENTPDANSEPVKAESPEKTDSVPESPLTVQSAPQTAPPVAPKENSVPIEKSQENPEEAKKEG